MRRAVRNLCSLLLTVAASAHAADASVVQIVEGRSIRFIVPPGHCAVDRGSDAGRAWYSYYERLNQGINVVLLLFANCEELSALSSGPTRRIREYGQYLRQVADGKEIPRAYTRQRYLAELARRVPKLQGQSIAEAATRRMEQFGDDATFNSVSLGLLDVTSDAVFVGAGIRLTQWGNSVRSGEVVAFTLVKQLPITINLLCDYTAGEVFERLLDTQRLLAAQFVAANP